MQEFFSPHGHDVWISYVFVPVAIACVAALSLAFLKVPSRLLLALGALIVLGGMVVEVRHFLTLSRRFNSGPTGYALDFASLGVGVLVAGLRQRPVISSLFAFGLSVSLAFAFAMFAILEDEA